jgi:fructokinase
MYAARKDIKVAWNPGVDELSAGWPKLKKLFPLVEVLSVNLDEAIQLAMSRGEKVQGMNPRVLIKKIHHFGQAMTVITQGSKGALVYDGSKLIFKSAPKIKAINSTGAGDAFTSGFVTGLIRFKGNISRALSLGIHNSASVVMHVGAQRGILSAKDIIKLNI